MTTELALADPGSLFILKFARKNSVSRAGRYPRGVANASARSHRSRLHSWRGWPTPRDRLANFVVLEKRALALGVELDIQKLLEVVGLNAIRDKKEAARQLARLVKDYTEYLGVPLGPIGTTDGPHADASRVIEMLKAAHAVGLALRPEELFAADRLDFDELS
jgi:hypothetical protein